MATRDVSVVVGPLWLLSNSSGLSSMVSPLASLASDYCGWVFQTGAKSITWDC